ncbi:YlmH family RNA-binding protein [Salinithrix halophila]|uniref:RNA-binding protein n=1 Tax=Salinithrix halophila TaxID=1485204 RepID=A0ABV8JCK9_9BACL
MTRKEDLFHHFRPDERMFVERVLDWSIGAEKRYQSVLTPFLNPREQRITDMLVRRAPDLSVTFDGGFSGAERCRARINPPYVVEEEYGLVFFMLEPAQSDIDMKHPDVLGTLLGLGMKRDKIGDIVPVEGGCQVVAAGEMSDYIRLQLTRVGRVPVRVSTIRREDLTPPIQETEDQSISVSSLRLDAVASDAFRIARSKVVPLIRNGRCQINWKITENPAAPLQEGDILSLRGFGRVQVGEILGQTKKGRLLVNLIRYM